MILLNHLNQFIQTSLSPGFFMVGGMVEWNPFLPTIPTITQSDRLEFCDLDLGIGIHLIALRVRVLNRARHARTT